MNEPGLPVTVAVRRADGSVERVRVGTAYEGTDGFTLQMHELVIGEGEARADSQPLGVPRASGGVGVGVEDLEFFAGRSRRVLADPSKARWHADERARLAAIEKEIARRRGDAG